MKILATKQRLAPATVRVGYIKHYFFCAFLSLFLLSGCGGSSGGGGDSTSSSKKAKAAKACTTPIPNGKGELPWNTKTKKYSTTCTLVTCNAGFDNDEDPTECQTTAANYYSPANDKTRTACPTAPPLSSPTGNTGLSSADGCYTCDGGYLKNTASNTCDVPGQGKYVNVGGAEASCNPIAIEGGATATWIAGAAATETACPFSCSAGFVKNEVLRSCNIPEEGKYVKNGAEAACNPITGVNGVSQFTKSTGGVSSAITCPFSCGAGYVKSDRSCNVPGLGKYADAGIEKSCDDPRGTVGGLETFLINTKGVSSATGCNFSCKQNHVKSVSEYSCKEGQTCRIANGAGFKATPSDPCRVVDCNAGYDNTQAPTTQCQQTASGHYSLANKGRTTCPAPPHSSATTTTGLSSAESCYTCTSGYLKKTVSNTCDVPSKGTYVNASGTEASCNPITIEGGATSIWIVGVAATADTCPFSCSMGYAKTGRACNIPGLGKYADNSGDEQSCNNPTGAAAGFDVFLPNMGAVSTATGCDFSCKFVKNRVNRTCNIPGLGKYADGSGKAAAITL